DGFDLARLRREGDGGREGEGAGGGARDEGSAESGHALLSRRGGWSARESPVNGRYPGGKRTAAPPKRGRRGRIWDQARLRVRAAITMPAAMSPAAARPRPQPISPPVGASDSSSSSPGAGASVGSCVGSADGSSLGCSVGSAVGSSVGAGSS